MHHPLDAPHPAHPDPPPSCQLLRSALRTLQSATPPASLQPIAAGSRGVLLAVLLSSLTLVVALTIHSQIRRWHDDTPALRLDKLSPTSRHSDPESPASEKGSRANPPAAAALSNNQLSPKGPLHRYSEDIKVSRPACSDPVMADQGDSGGGDAELDGLPGIPDENAQDDSIPDAEDLLETPQQLLSRGDEPLSGDLTHRYQTRARARQEKALEERGGARATPLFSKLQAASGRANARASSSRLEDSKDIQSPRGDGEEDENDGAEEGEEEAAKDIWRPRTQPTSRPRSTKGRLSTSRRRSARITAHRGSQPTGVAPRKRATGNTNAASKPKRWPPRRSPRLARPLTEFHKFPELPAELQIMVWKQAVAPRLVYVRNRSAPNPSYTVQNPRPSWFMACTTSANVAEKSYRKMFALWRPDNHGAVQPVNPDIDLIALEPCGNGCRAHYCTRHQFSDVDRAAVRLLAVQTESEYLLPTARACWETISQSWPNVETLYLMRRAITGDNPGEHILFRIEEGTRETQLRGMFNAWKKGAGKDKPMVTLEFVAAEPKQDVASQGQGSSPILHGRKTGGPEDIIIG